MDQKRKFKHGFTLGKFMPPHTGHMHLIRASLEHVSHLTVLVCTVRRESIPGEIRFQWMKELISDGNITLVHVTEEVPSYPHEHSDFWAIWESVLKRNIHPETEVFFSSEEYGDEVASRLNIRHIKIDALRTAVPVSGTAIRERPLTNWNFIPDVVRPYFVKRVVLTGPESTGKTTMTHKLGTYFNTGWVEEYGREHFLKVGGKLTLEDISQIATTQLQWEDAAAKHANRILFCDTDLIVTQVWSEIYFNECPEWISSINRQRRYDLFLLMDIDIPWVDDGSREFPQLREYHFNRLKHELDSRHANYRIISGNFEERFLQAVNAVQQTFF